MYTPPMSSLQSGKFKIWLLLLVGSFCIVPSLLNLMGVDFGLHLNPLSPAFHTQGLLLHTILLWTATCMAFFTFLLAFFHYFVRRDIVTPVIGISLLWGGFFDLFQTLAADRFIQASVDSHELIPFTWAIGRTFGILILILGVMILMMRGYRGRAAGNTRFFILLGLAFGLAAFALMDYVAHSEELPQIIFPDLLISRPWDVMPLFLYALAGLWVFRRFHQARRDHFSFCLWVSVVPDIVAQLHMAFGSVTLFDNSYNLAYVLKVVSYMVPALGLLKDYVDTHRQLDQEMMGHRRSEQDRKVLASLVDSTREMVGLLDAQGKIQYANRALLQNLGLDVESIKNLPLAKLLNRAESSSVVRNMLERLLTQGHAFGELELVTSDGARLIPAEYHMFSVGGPESSKVIGVVFYDITAQKQIGEDRERHDQALRKLISRRTAELAQMNESMRKELAERKHLEERLVEAQKMEAMGQLSAGIAHEINNPVGYVNVNLQMLGQYINTYESLLTLYSNLDSGDAELCPKVLQEVAELKEKSRFARISADVGPLLDDSRKGLARVMEIVKSLRMFSHPDDAVIQQVSLVEILEDSLRMVWNHVKKHEIVREYDTVPKVPGLPVQLSQVFVNLLLNAAQAIEGTGKITIRIRQRGNHLMVSIVDTGQGISKQHYSRLFDPFFTTKPVGQGTGLGLYISYGIIQKHQGDLVFHSEDGKGTTFQVILPTQLRL